MRKSAVNRSLQSRRKGRKYSRSTRKINGGTRTPAPFIEFARANRDAIKAANPHFNLGDTAKELMSMWKKMSPGKRAIYDKTATSTRSKK